MVDLRSRELGDFLRTRRLRLTPRQVGLSQAAGRRRTPGLRREEVAELAGISVDWYVRLEQGRASGPSASTVDALARALELSEAEREHLHRMASGGGARRWQPEAPSAALLRMLGELRAPAYLTGRRRDLIAWNDPANEIFAFDELDVEDRNVLVSMLTLPRSRELFGADWAAVAQRMIAAFRATHDLYAHDPAFVALVVRLRRECTEFEEWWARHDVRTSGSGHKTLHHPARGTITYVPTGLRVGENPDLKLVIYTQARSEM